MIFWDSSHHYIFQWKISNTAASNSHFSLLLPVSLLLLLWLDFFLALAASAWDLLLCTCHWTLSTLQARHWPKVSDFVARFCTLCELKNLRPCENCTRFSHGSRFFDLRNVQKSVTQIIYLGPLPTAGAYFNSRLPDGLLGYCQPAHVCSPKYINPPLLTFYSCATDVDPISQSSVLANLFFPSLYPVATADQCNSLINASAFK